MVIGILLVDRDFFSTPTECVPVNRRHGFLFSFACLAFATSASAAGQPDEWLNVKLAAPIRTWGEAVPPGNGLLGGLLRGETNRLRLPLARGDLWNLRPPPAIHKPGFPGRACRVWCGRGTRRRSAGSWKSRMTSPPRRTFPPGRARSPSQSERSIPKSAGQTGRGPAPGCCAVRRVRAKTGPLADARQTAGVARFGEGQATWPTQFSRR